MGWPKGGCVCQARSHPLVTNCLNCGKIICSAEADLNCSFCGNPLTFTNTQTEAELTAKFKKMRSKYQVQKEQADKFVDRLVKADEVKASSQIIDESLSLSNRSWMTKEQILAEENAYRAKIEDEKNKRKEITIDIPLRKY